MFSTLTIYLWHENTSRKLLAAIAIALQFIEKCDLLTLSGPSKVRTKREVLLFEFIPVSYQHK